MSITTVLVAGASGFVGRHTLNALQTMPQVRSIALVRNPEKLPAEFTGEVRQGDIRDQAFLDRALQGIDALCVCTAWTSAWGHAGESETYLRKPTIELIDAALRHGIQRIVFPSSVSARVLRDRQSKAASDAMESLWPHMANVNRIEDHMRRLASRDVSMIALRLGHFVGAHYGLGLLPILLPRLRSHLVPWVNKGRTTMPLIAGQDVGQAMARAAIAPALQGFTTMDVVGKETPSTREVFHFLHTAYGYPLPHFGVSFSMAYAFARFMETVSKFTPWDPFITRSVVLLLEETAVSNERATRLLGYAPQVHWQDAIRTQLAEMQRDRVTGLRMARPIPAPLDEATA